MEEDMNSFNEYFHAHVGRERMCKLLGFAFQM